MDEILGKIAMVLITVAGAIMCIALICMIISIVVSTFGGK
mgnify:CR=1 FL=1